MSTPFYTTQEAHTRETFLALMWSLSYPGTPYNLPHSVQSLMQAFEAIGETLLDLETSFYTPDPALHSRLARNGAPFVSADNADYHFYPSVNAHTLDDMSRASVGTALYPDSSATLIIACQFQQGLTLRLTGAGIPHQTTLQVGGLPREFWQLRAQANQYPLGWDVFLVDEMNVMGIPRTTTIVVGDES
jgi:alpha-D-ribose 1-methylphosphonate 5-triphosphate synthase subunit PhnH